MNEIEIQKEFFHPICTEDEVERIFNVQNARDHLLKIRAETIVDNMRLFRVFRHKAIAAGALWSLENSFEATHWNSVLERFPKAERDLCNTVTFGDIISTDPNGMIFATDYGPIATICNSMQYFAQFANLALLDFKTEVPQHIRLNALKISMRVMLKTEAMDFAVDPRGRLPADVAETSQRSIPWTNQFIVGHEFAHYLLGHLSKHSIVQQPILCATSSQSQDYKPSKVYNPSQRNEFEADIQSLLIPNYTEDERGRVLTGALVWLTALELFEHISDLICPKSPYSYRSHPSAADRHENLLTNIPTPKGFKTKNWEHRMASVDHLKKLLTEDVGYNIEHYEFYGSVYLDRPNSNWRGPELIDRVDY